MKETKHKEAIAIVGKIHDDIMRKAAEANAALEKRAGEHLEFQTKYHVDAEEVLKFAVERVVLEREVRYWLGQLAASHMILEALHK